MKLQICNSLKNILPEFSVSAYTFDLLEVNDSENLSTEITNAFETLTKEYQQIYTIENVVNIDKIKVNFFIALHL